MTADEHESNRRLMSRPWEAAEDSSLWEITGAYRRGGTFGRCIATVLPKFVTGSDTPLFKMIGALDDLVTPAEITHAVPLLIVHRGNPRMPYYLSDSVWMDGDGQ